MRSRLAGTVMLSAVVFFVVAVLVSVGVLWWSADVTLGIVIGGICGAAAALTFGAVVRAMGRSGDGHKRFACHTCGAASFIIRGAQWSTMESPTLEVGLRCANCGTTDTVSLSVVEARRCGFEEPASS